MIMYRVAGEDVGKFMARLLREDVFDSFEVRGLEITSFTHVEISGEIPGQENPETGKPSYWGWERIRPLAVHLVRGKTRPRHLRLVLALPSHELEGIHQNAGALMLNIHYESATDEVRIGSGVSPKKFTLEKGLEAEWDKYLEGFVLAHKIPVTEKI